MNNLWRSKKVRNNIYAWLLLLPSFIFLYMFTFLPIGQTFVLSLFRADLSTPDPFFIGLENFRLLAEDKVFWKVIRNNAVFAIGTVPLSLGIGLVMAILVNRAIRGISWIRTFFFYPTVIPMIAIANIWLFMYTPNYGLINQVLSIVSIPGINWLGSPSTVMIAMIIMVIWKEAGFFMIFYLAGLQNISKELYESAKIDGASTWTVFWKITFPLLMPTTLFVFIIAVTNSFKLVDHLVIMTQGGPNNASNLLLYYIYETAFSYWDQGRAAALTVVMLVMMVAIAAWQFFGIDRKIHYS
ncbi:sugar ABC transporter permease [Alkalihalobacillus sp. LMS39]|uniref:carbohydrate ABC transporter permease n=1 Tax=Alkalihalobacillus sp. LMS39 TaxID=2924032 RepID=UPI001FB29468|nr:sugar ABC transporter permease [Alkalihalobacillus sp. LMS39]UOE94424.1 sugar ABC transporter permease [Alkalihalobacillus sp. LMS39]